MKFYMVVNAISYRYIKSIVDSAWDELRSRKAEVANFLICDNVNDLSLESGSVVFVIGEPFPDFDKRTGVKFVFINFSVLMVLGSPLSASLSAYKVMRLKRRLLENRFSYIDYLLDYWPTQADRLRSKFAKFDVPVGVFPVSLKSLQFESLIALEEREYDVCFVGSLSSRRKKILEQLRDRGISLSPSTGVDLEDVSRKSRIVLNLRSHRSNHFELPRVLGAFASGAALVTETTYSMGDYVRAGTYVSAEFSALSDCIVQLLSAQEKMKRIAAAGYAWLNGEYSEYCTRAWDDLIGDVETRFQC